IADSGNNRVVIGQLSDDGHRLRVERFAGSGTRGFADGIDGTFNYPQGIVFDGDDLYVADAGNHAIRRVVVATGEISTFAGTGEQLRTRVDLEAGALSSPWDLTQVGSTLFVAMAGTHQLYAIDTKTREVRAHSGNGREDIADGKHGDAALAQPMGIAAAGAR